MKILSSLAEMSAADGFPVVLLSGLQAFGALALIVCVLLIMERIYKKKHPNNEQEKDVSDEKTSEKTGEKGENE